MASVFVDVLNDRSNEDVLRKTLCHVTKSFGFEVIPAFAEGDPEPDIIIVGSPERALHFMKATDESTVAIFQRTIEASSGIESVTRLYPRRIKSESFERFIPFLLKLAVEKKKEEIDANSARG